MNILLETAKKSRTKFRIDGVQGFEVCCDVGAKK